MCFPPLTWQTFDIDFSAVSYGPDGKFAKAARMTVRHNGVVVQNDVELPLRATPSAPVAYGPDPGPIVLQDQGTPVRFRNVWFLEKK
jgi:hypothetical protein